MSNETRNQLSSCSSIGCTRNIHIRSDIGELCLFHAPAESKKQSLPEFHNAFVKHARDHSDFRHFVFPNGFLIKSVSFPKGADFSNATFAGDAHIAMPEFGGDVSFIDNEFMGAIRISRPKFAGGSNFYFRTPAFVGVGGDSLIEFADADFPIDRSYFRIVRGLADQSSKLVAPRLLLRSCALQGIFFENCDFNLFSFYSSAGFAEAHKSNCRWPMTKDKLFGVFVDERLHVAAEEWVVGRMMEMRSRGESAEEFCKHLSVPVEFGWHEVGVLYRKQKVSSDASKDYETASWLYYNESEMKLRSLLNRNGTNPSKLSRLQSLLRPFALSWQDVPSKLVSAIIGIYKYWAGFGERPVRSVLWFLAATLGFGALYSTIGLRTPYEGAGHAGWFTGTLLGGLYALLRLIPTGYMPGFADQWHLESHGVLATVVSLLNLLVLTLLLVFIAIGFKRRFRRY